VNFSEFLKYDPGTGDLIWIKKPSNVCKPIAGSFHKASGYIVIKFNKIQYKSHRLAWYLHYGTWPKGEIDHVNGIKTDNRINNLRDVTHTENMNNTKGHRNKTFKYYRVRNNSYQVRYTQNLITYSKYFKTEMEAKMFIQQLELI
jgi:hypothetical protein